MTTFDEREKGFENKFAHDAELAFKSQARATNKLLLWAAGEMGKSGDDAVAYARTRLGEWLKPGAGDMLAKIAADVAVENPKVPEAAVRAKFAEFMTLAQKQILEEG
jgi:hypothetical protein